MFRGAESDNAQVGDCALAEGCSSNHGEGEAVCDQMACSCDERAE